MLFVGVAIFWKRKLGKSLSDVYSAQAIVHIGDCRHCAADVQAGAMHCPKCGVFSPTSELAAAMLSPSACAVYTVVLALLVVFWFW